jgi:hypothetical protein
LPVDASGADPKVHNQRGALAFANGRVYIPYGGRFGDCGDYKGRIVGRQDYGAGSTYVGGVIDIEALRDHRARAQWDNWMKDLRTELYQLLYEKPIYPKNLYLKRAPMKHAEYREKVIKRQIRLMHDRGIWKKPER